LVRFLGEQKMNKEEMIVPLWRDWGVTADAHFEIRAERAIIPGLKGKRNK
jgi:hypothetical protein